MKALKQFFVLAAVLLSAELAIAYVIISDYQAQKAVLEAQKNYIGETGNSQTDRIEGSNTLKLTSK
jgi:uncharacterized protein (UPF0333 family)